MIAYGTRKMIKRLSVAPPNSVVLVMAPSAVDIPVEFARTVTATPSCIAIATSCFADGETEIALGDFDTPQRADRVAYDGVLETPDASVDVCSVYNEVLLQIAVTDPRSRVRVWVNADSEPNVIEISVTVASDIESFSILVEESLAR